MPVRKAIITPRMTERGAILEGRAIQEKRFIGVLRLKNQSSEPKLVNPDGIYVSFDRSKSLGARIAANPDSKWFYEPVHAEAATPKTTRPRLPGVAVRLLWARSGGFVSDSFDFLNSKLPASEEVCRLFGLITPEGTGHLD